MTTINDVDTEKRSDMIAEALTTGEMETLIDGLTGLSLSLGRVNPASHVSPERRAIWDLRSMIGEACATRQRNEKEA
jgi:hypothetical protein